MKDKQIYELNEEDLLASPVWYFPMDGSVEDELTIRPRKKHSDDDDDKQCIVKTIFTTRSAKKYVGYIYWGYPTSIENLKPVMFVGDDCVTFWNGMMQPPIDEIKSKKGGQCYLLLRRPTHLPCF